MTTDDGHQRLAAAILRQAAFDFTSGKFAAEREELLQFLSGQSSIGKFWWEISGMAPLCGNPEELSVRLQEAKNCTRSFGTGKIAVNESIRRWRHAKNN